jgi:hypothetical protein
MSAATPMPSGSAPYYRLIVIQDPQANLNGQNPDPIKINVTVKVTGHATIRQNERQTLRTSLIPSNPPHNLRLLCHVSNTLRYQSAEHKASNRRSGSRAFPASEWSAPSHHAKATA